MANNNGLIIGIVIVIILLVAVAVYLGSGTHGPSTTTSTSSTSYSTTSTIPTTSTTNTTTATTTIPANQTEMVPVGMTDPPSVPAGTQAVLISYSNVQLHMNGSNSSSWINASGSGTVNTLAVVNASQTIAAAQIAANSTINAVRMNITSAQIIINGTTYTADAPAMITANITGSQAINSSNSAVLADFVTRVNVTSTNSTTNVSTYAYTVSASKAVLTSNATVSINIGTIVNLSTITKIGLGLNI